MIDYFGQIGEASIKTIYHFLKNNVGGYTIVFTLVGRDMWKSAWSADAPPKRKIFSDSAPIIDESKGDESAY